MPHTHTLTHAQRDENDDLLDGEDLDGALEQMSLGSGLSKK